MGQESEFQDETEYFFGLLAFAFLVVLIVVAFSPGGKIWAVPGQAPFGQTGSSQGVEGKAYLQGRSDHGGATITVAGKEDVTGPDGGYCVTGVATGICTTTAAMSNYLYARKEGVVVEENKLTTLPDVTLLAGNPNDDEEIDGWDLFIVGSNFTAIVTPGTNGDINANGEVEGFDLFWVGRNFTKEAPGPW